MDNKQQRPEKYHKSPAFIFILGLVLFAFIIYLYNKTIDPAKTVPIHKITYSEFVSKVDAGSVKEVTITGTSVNGTFYKPPAVGPDKSSRQDESLNFSTVLPTFQGSEILGRLERNKVAINIDAADTTGFWQIVVMLLPWALIIGVWILIIRRTQQQQGGGLGGGLFSFGASKAKLFDAKKPGVTFKDVAGLTNAKKELEETVEFLKNPKRFTRLGAKVPKGILLIGPPGTGKTLMARATAGEAGVPFFSISASEFIEMFVGVGASRVRDMFNKAKAASPSIIFIDEIDSVGRTRGTGLGGGHDEREQTLNQLLSEMDGFETHEKLIVMAATNRPDVLDPALLRTGRFDRHIIIDRPGRKERREILLVHVANKTLAKSVDLDKIAASTPGMTGADLENIANEAALEASKKGKEEIDSIDFEDALDKVLMGTKREEAVSDEERRITAYHEAGHALVSFELPYTDPIHKISIIPRGMAMGVTQFLPKEDRHYYPKRYLVNRLVVALAGRAAEKLVFNDVSSGASDDLKNATSLAERMISVWGMSDIIGPINLGRSEEHPFLGKELTMPKRYSERMAWMMDQEIRKIILEAESTADKILLQKKDALERLAEALLKEELIESTEAEKIIRGK